MHDTRRRMVELLRVRGGLTVDDLLRALRVTRTAVTSHLAALQAEGLVARQGLRPGRRRPSALFVLTPKADGLFPKAYDAFALSIVEELGGRGPDALRMVLRRVGDRWIARDLPRVQGVRGAQRLERVRAVLAERGFFPVLDRTPEGYLLREHNCPLMQLALAHPEICEMVHRWLQALAGTPVVRVKCLRLGDPYSAYAIAGRAGRTTGRRRA